MKKSLHQFLTKVPELVLFCGKVICGVVVCVAYFYVCIMFYYF